MLFPCLLVYRSSLVNIFLSLSCLPLLVYITSFVKISMSVLLFLWSSTAWCMKLRCVVRCIYWLRTKVGYLIMGHKILMCSSQFHTSGSVPKRSECCLCLHLWPAPILSPRLRPALLLVTERKDTFLAQQLLRRLAVKHYLISSTGESNFVPKGSFPLVAGGYNMG